MSEGPLSGYRRLVERGELTGDAAQERAASQLDALHSQLQTYQRGRRSFFGSANPPPKGLYIFGEVGRGKSMLMDLFFSCVENTPKRRVHFHAFMVETHAAIHAWRQMTPKLRAQQPNFVREAGDDPIQPVAEAIARSATLLCFDEFQVTNVADAMILGRLFENLLARGVVIVATSNRAPEELYLGGINRQLFLPFINMIRERMGLIHLDGPMDYRLAKLKGFELYWSPLGPEADQGLAEAWRSLTGLDHGEPTQLSVQGRTLRIREQAKGVARLGFGELCEEPLGPADYLSLAHSFHTLIISRIPRLDPEKRNEAKRFVTLIDTLYDNKVKLICSAAASPDELCTQGELAFEFKRTASRLIEMQSADYLQLSHAT
jgi:cell division protein ZapE